jgi:branched-chain amino acid transport system substrate-binding protein
MGGRHIGGRHIGGRHEGGRHEGGRHEGGTDRRRALLASGAVALLLGSAAFGCGSDGSDSGGKPEYVIGFQGPTSGDSQQLGINGLGGVKTAVDLANSSGDLPFVVGVVTSDDQGTPDGGPTAAQKLIDNPDVVAVVGPMFSGATKASEPQYTQAGLLSVSPSATNPALTALGFRTFYRVISSDVVQGGAAADYVAKVVQAKKVFSLDDRSEYGVGLSESFENALTAYKVEFVHDGVNPTKDYTSEATKIIAENPDVVYYAGYYPEFALLAKALRTKGYTGNLMAGDGSNDDEFIAQAGPPNAEGAFLTCACGDANSDPDAASFVEDYKRVNDGAKPGTYSGEAFDATNAIIDVLRKQGTGATRQSVAAAFGSVDLEGVTKRVTFTPKGDVTDKAVFVYQITGGQRRVLGPTTDLIKP